MDIANLFNMHYLCSQYNVNCPDSLQATPSRRCVSHKKRHITDIADWAQAFAVYTAALVRELAYMVTIIKASQQYDGLYWRAYDTHYRLTAVATGNRNWSRLDTDLFTRFFTGRARPVSPCSTCNSTSHFSTDWP